MTVEPSRFEIQIQSGLHAGAVETLPEGRHRIGSDIEADIVLVEDGIAPIHVAIGLSGRFARIEALSDGVTIDGRGPLAVGGSADVPIPTAFAIGGTRIFVAPDAQTAGDPASASAPSLLALPASPAVRALIALQVLAVLALMVVPNPVADALSPSGPRQIAVASPAAAGATAGADAEGSIADRMSGEPPAVTGSVPSPAALPVRAARPDAAADHGRPSILPLRPRRPADAPPALDAARALQAELERVGLLNVVIDAGPGIVTAAGTIEPSTAVRWQSVQQWFDERFAGEITSVNSVGVKAEKLPVSLGIEAVWRGDQSHLIIRGQKYLEGAVLEGGWSIHRIEAERVILQRDGRLVAVRY
jgi:type III secretion protein D